MYVIIEMQTNNGTTTVTPVQTAETREQAESIWHSIMSLAAVSQVEIHTATVLNPEGQLICTGTYKHTQG